MLASRLGVAALIVIALSFFANTRPFGSVHVVKIDASDSEKEGEPRVTIGPFTIDPDATERETIQEGMQALRESGVLREEEVAALQAELERQRVPPGRDTVALEAAGWEIARELSAREVEKSDTSQPDRLSESEIQNLVVERLLSVQNQMQENEITGENLSVSTPSSAPTPQGSVGDMTSPVEPVPLSDTTIPDAPDAAVTSRTLKRVEGNFSGETLMGTDFRNQDLSGLDFSNARLTAAKFDGSDLSGANFSGAQIQGASFADAIMDDINLTNAQAQTAHFERASLLRANLGYANFAGAVLTGADLRGAIMDSLNLNGAVMSGTRMGEVP